MSCKIINTKLGEIEYHLVGKGISILFIHGGHSNCNEKLCHKGFDLEKFQLITPSRPGYGKTPLNNNKTPKQAADLIIGLLHHLSIDHVIVYGISAGGLTAIELASHYPNKVSKLILASAVSKKWLDNKGGKYKIAKKIFNPKIEKIVWVLVRFFSTIFPTIVAKNFYPQFSKNPIHKLKKEDIQELILSMKDYNSKMGFINDINQNINDDIFTSVKCPTLIVHSKNDNSVPFEHALYSKKMIKNSQLLELNSECGHLFWIGSDSKNTIEKIIKFIET